MNDVQIKLRCLEMAVERANKENATSFEERVAELSTWFYNRIITEPAAIVPEPVQPLAKADSGKKQIHRTRDKSAPDILS